MKQLKLKNILTDLLLLSFETEWVEFKKAENNIHFDELGKYFSALSNEANLKNEVCGWLIFGVDNKTKKIVGTNYRRDRVSLDSLKFEIAEHTTNRLTFVDIFECIEENKRAIMFQIPAASRGIPTAWKGHYYGRDGESIVALNIHEIEQIRRQSKPDWSAQICETATINDLSPEAITKARNEFSKKHPKLREEIKQWDDVVFLNKAKLTICGKITNSTIILLGRPESEPFISPAVAKISWILKSEQNQEKDYEHFGPPLILSTEAILSKIRNLNYRYLPDNTLFPIEITQYEPYVIREALHNCVVHQDYELKSRIIIVEKQDELVFSNVGSFLPGSVEKVIEQDSPQHFYRNQFLANAMVNLNMIDTIGGGIKKMFLAQRNRFFPLPTYKLDEPDKVTVKITGKIIDENYTRLIMRNLDLDLRTVILLDNIQKKIKLPKFECKHLKDLRLVEGRYPKIFVVSKIAAITEDKASYIKYRAFDNKYYKNMISDFIKEYGSASRKEIDRLIFKKLSDTLDEKQKLKKIDNLLFEMSKRDGTIKNEGTNKKPKWVLC